MKFGEQKISFELSELLVPSEWINETETGKCYLGVFPNTNAKDIEAFYFGQKYFKKYYTYFDLNIVQSKESDKLRIGTGLRNTNINILNLQYNVNADGFDHQSGDQSQWTYEPNVMSTLKDEDDDVVTRFIKKNMELFIICCVILAFLILTLIGLCVYLRKKSNKNRMGNVFKDKLTYYGK